MSLESVKNFVEQFHSKHSKLHVLVCNAGIWTGNELKKSKDGYESTFATNHLGHFLLINLLLDDLKKSAPSRIAIVASQLHRPGVGGGKLNPYFQYKSVDAVNFEGVTYNGEQAYKNSKLANVLTVHHLAKMLEGTNVTVNALCPGFIPTTGLSRNTSYIMGLVLKYILVWLPFTRTEDHGSDCIVDVAVDPKLEGVTGKYFSDRKAIPPSDDSQNVEYQQQLWDFSMKLCENYLKK